MRLEDRILLAAQPVVDVQDQSIQLGSQATLAVVFDNQPDGSPGGDVGYAPYIDLVLPQNGADGGGPGNAPVNDGVSFLSASYLGASVDATVVEFDLAGQAMHPFARDAAGNPLVVLASSFGAGPGDQLVVLRLPFGSFVADQPPAAVAVSVQLSDLADIDQPLVFGAQGGFAFGLDPLNNPTADPPIRGAIDSAVITPTLFTVTKSFSGPEGETATGPNFPRTYTISFDLAAGQTVTDGVLRDVLPDGIRVNGPITLTGAPGSVSFDPLTNLVTATLSGAVVGVAGAEAQLIIPFYVEQFLTPGQPGVPVLNPPDGAFRTLSNDVTAQADWTPIDPRDPPQTVTFDPPGPENVFTAKSIAVQKSQAIAVDANAPGLGPGDTLGITIDGQVSDYFRFGRLVVTDILSDGQVFLPGTATLSVTEAGGTLGSGGFTNVTATRDALTGQTTLVFDLSAQLLANGASDEVLAGSAALGAATFRIAFQTQVERFFLATGDAVGQGDSVGNNVAVAGDVIGAGGVVTGGNGDTSSSGGTIETGAVSKEIYAVNGTILAPGTPVSVSSGDEVTFRLTYALPQTLAQSLALRDFLPLPVFDVSTLTLSLSADLSPLPPPVDTVKWGPDSAGFRALLTTIPVLTFDVPSNSFTITFNDLEPAVPTASTADVLFTLRVADRPFGDGLLLTNQLQSIETSTTSVVTTASAIRQLTLNEPALDITKGVIAFEGSPGVFTPAPPGPVAFTAPGSAGVRFGGTIDSTNLGLIPVDSDLLDVDAGDRVSFAIVVENTGRGRNGAFDVLIRDSLPQGFVVGPGGLNLQVTDGAGNALAFTGDLFTTGIDLTDPGPTTGALAPFSPTGGANILVITYDLVITETPQPRSQITNLTDIGNYAAVEGGLDRVPNSVGPTEDVATVTIGDPAIEKSLVATSVSETSGNALAIGETVTFELVATLREGRIRDLVLADLLPTSPGRLDFVSANLVSIGANLFERDSAGSVLGPLGAPVIANSGNLVTFTFASDVVNLPDDAVTDADRIVVRVTAVAADVAGNRPGATAENEGQLRFTAGGGTVTLSDVADARIVGPAVALTKTADTITVQAGNIVTYTVEARLGTGPDDGPAFDLRLDDPLLAGQLTLVAGSAALLVQPAGGATISEAGGVITVTAPVALPGEVLRFTYQARVEPTVIAGTTLPNTVEAEGDSYPGVPPTGVERPFSLTATDSVTVPGAGIVKTVSEADTSLPETGSVIGDAGRVDLAIGETVTYRLTITLPEAVSTNLAVRDLLPGSVPVAAVNEGLFEFISASITRIGTSLSGPGLAAAAPVADDLNGDGIDDSVTFSFGDVTNTPNGLLDAEDQIEIAVTARVRDNPANRAGQVPVNTATVSFGGTTQSASALVDIVEPDLGIEKDSSDTAGDAGDRVAFSVSIPFSGTQAGPAFNVTVTDTVPVGLDIDAATLQYVTLPPPGATLSYDSLTRTITAFVPTYQLISGVVQFRYEAVVDNAVRPAEVLTNTAAVSWTSHPGNPPAEYQRTYGPQQDSTSFTVDLPALSKRVIDTDIPATGIRPGEVLQDVAIGETVTYLLTLRLPETTTNLVLSDVLPRSAGAPPVAGDMRLIEAELVAVGAHITGAGIPPIGSPGLQSDSNADGIVDRVDWDFGLVTNLADNVQDAEDLIIVRVVARVVDVAENQPGDLLVNTGQVEYSRADGSSALITQTETVRIVGPELAIAKTPLPGSGDAGDLITYTLTIGHVPGVSSADAYALSLTDLLDPRLALVAGSVTASLAGAVVATGNAPGDTTIAVTLDQYAVDAAPFTITYQARLTEAVRPGTSVPNTAQLGWQSAPAGFVDARPDETLATNVVDVVFPGTLSKVVTATSLPETPDTGVPDLTPGETVTYTLTLTLGEGTQRVLLTDTLPTGLGLVSAEVASIGANISGTLLGVGAAPVVAGNLLTFDFGNAVVNAGDNVIDARDRITVQVTARLLDLPGNTANTVLVNGAAFATDDATRTATAPVEVVLPQPLIAKDASVATGDAGDLVTFTVVVSQAAGATGPLYDLMVTDLLPASFVLVAGSAAASRGTVTEGAGSVTLALSGAALLAADSPLTAFDDTRVTLTYQARLADGVEPGEEVRNTAGFTGTSAPTGTPEARPFSGSDGALVTVVMPVTLDKTIAATSNPDTPGTSVSVGETITYRLAATLSEGTQTLEIRDTLPAGLEVIGATVVSVGSGVTAGAPTITIAGQDVTFDFDTVVNAGNNLAGDGTVTVEIVARVRDVAGNVSGTALTNAGAVTIASPLDPLRPGGTQTDADDTTATVVAPALVLDKAVPPGFARPGEVLTYTLTLSHAAVSTAAAYDIVLTDLLADPNLDLVAGSVTTTLGTVVLGNGAGDTTIRVEIGALALGQDVTITYGARVLAAAPPGATLTNTATAAWDSNPGPGGRPDATTDGTATPLQPGFAKTIAGTSNPDTGSGQFDPALPDLAVGESLTYRLTITLPQGVTDALVLSDLLPAGLLPLDARVASIGAGLTLGAPAIGIAGQAVTIGFGTVTNASGPGIGPEDLITVEIDARVVDLPGLSAGAPLVNAAALAFSIDGRTGSLDATAPAELVEPALAIAKAVDRPSGDAGDLFTYTVTIAQGAASTAPAYDITVVDALDPRLVLVSASATAGIAAIAGNTVTLSIPRLLLGDPAVTLTYTARLADAVEPGQSIPNTAALAWDSNPGPGGRTGTGSATADVDVVLALDLDKAIIATSLPETTSGRILPGVTDLAIGEEVTYELVARLGEGTQTLRISDILPAGLLPLPGGAVVVSTGASISAGPGGTLTPVAAIAGQDVSFDFGTLVNAGDNLADAGDLVTVRITARVLDVPTNLSGQILTNDATATTAAPGDPGATVTDGAAVPAAIVEPGLALAKAVDRPAADAGDVFTYTLTLTTLPGATGPAYDIVIADILPTPLVLVPGSLSASFGTATSTGNAITVTVPVLAPGAAPITITYRAAFGDAIEPGQVVPNTATLDWTSAPGGGRAYADDATAAVRGVFALVLDKSIIATSLPETGSGFFDPALPDVAAGETVTWRLTATLSEGTARLVIADALPAGLVAESARVVALSPGITAGPPVITLASGNVVFDFGTVVNTGDNAGPDTIVVEVTARLSALPAPGTVLTNTATATVTAPTDPGAPGGTLTARDSASAEAVAAVLLFDKQVSGGVVQLGDQVTYTLVLQHAPGSTAPAYGVVLSDPLSDPALQLVSGSVTASAGTITQGNGGGDRSVTVTLPVLLPGETLSVGFVVRTVAVPVPDGIAPNTAVFASTSAPGAQPPGFTRPLAGSDTTAIQIIVTPVPGGFSAGLLPDLEDALRRLRVEPSRAGGIITGTAQPLSTVVLEFIDATGTPIRIGSTTTDVGGNWVARAPEPVAPPFPTEALQEVRQLVGRAVDAGLGATTQAPLVPPTPLPLNGGVPYTVAGAAIASPGDLGGQVIEPIAVTYAGGSSPGGLFTGARGLGNPGVQGGLSSLAAGAGGSPGEGALGGGLALNRFALDFLRSQVSPTALGR